MIGKAPSGLPVGQDGREVARKVSNQTCNHHDLAIYFLNFHSGSLVGMPFLFHH